MTKVSQMYADAQTMWRTITDDREIDKINYDEIFWKELELKVKEGESPLKLQINGKTREGKSTVGQAIGIKHLGFLRKHGKTKEKFNIKNIARDDFEESRKVLSGISQTVIVTDEEDPLEKGGMNATAEQQMKEHQSKVQAVNQVHIIRCTPKGIVDGETEMLLDVIKRDKEKKQTICKLYYRWYEGQIQRMQYLGIVTINVQPVIKNWIEQGLEEIYEKKTENRTKQEQQKLEEWAKKDWYVEYQLRKKGKIDLINKFGIQRPRELEYADIILETIHKLQISTKLGGQIKKATIKNYTKQYVRKGRIPNSIIGVDLITDEARGVLDVMSTYYDNKNKQETKIEQLNNPKSRLSKIRLKKDIEILKEVINNDNKLIKEQLKEFEFYVKIKKDYNQYFTF